MEIMKYSICLLVCLISQLRTTGLLWNLNYFNKFRSAQSKIIIIILGDMKIFNENSVIGPLHWFWKGFSRIFLLKVDSVMDSNGNMDSLQHHFTVTITIPDGNTLAMWPHLLYPTFSRPAMLLAM